VAPARGFQQFGGGTEVTDVGHAGLLCVLIIVLVFSIYYF
jgi:hypothetical protein